MEPSTCNACPFAPALSRLIVSLALILVSARFCAADPLFGDTRSVGWFITSICRDLQGRLWVAGENAAGVWSYDPAAKLWTHFPASPDLSADTYAITCDKKGRIWAGGLAGVSVWNGQQWRQYGPTDGPLGSRLFALAVNPKDGAVWGATEAGLFRYQNNAWTYYTRADGLPSDQAEALAFAPDGTLYVATQCDGLAIGSPANDYETWRIVSGPRQLPNAPAGDGLPSNLLNTLLVARNGAVYCGTDAGLAVSRDKGRTWRFRRGANWRDKANALFLGPKPPPAGDKTPLLLEDYVTALAEDGAGHLLIGHRAAGLEVWDEKTQARLYPGPNDPSETSYVISLLPLQDGSVLQGLYGGGVVQKQVPGLTPPLLAAAPLSASAPPLPAPAKPPTLAELTAMLKRVHSLTGTLPVGGGAYLGEDWQTQGDWVGHYGRQYAVLCAAASPMDQVLTWDSHYAVTGSLGPHFEGDDSLRHWIQPGMVNTPRLASLYSPVDGFRIEATWDDHSETYPYAYDGPDVWAAVTVPAGIHRLSLYVTNKDGHNGGPFTYRDYPVDLLPYRAKMADALALKPLAHTRIVNFYDGMYKSFVVRGPSKYYVRLGRNGSLCTLLSSHAKESRYFVPTCARISLTLWQSVSKFR